MWRPPSKKGQKDNPGSYRPISLTSVPKKVMEQIILGAITDQLKVNQRIRPSQHGFTNGRSCLTNLISFYDEMTRLVDKGKAVDVVYLDFSKAFETVPHTTFLWRSWLPMVWMGVHSAGWNTIWMAGPKELWSMELNPVGSQSWAVSPRAQYWLLFNIFIIINILMRRLSAPQ